MLILVDGSNYLFRAYYAIRELSNSKGFPTNAIYGFTAMLIKLKRDWNPRYLAVVFDLKGPTFRHEAYEDYKANRKPMPETLIPQIAPIKDIIRGFSIPVLEKQGLEADDIIGTLARRSAAEGVKVIIVSGDKDMMQLVTDDVVMVDTMKDKIYDRLAVRERFGVFPEQVPEILGLTGDASDNIPGVPGIGPKGALTLIDEYATVEGVIANADKIKSARMQQAVKTFADQARLSRRLAEIRTDADIDFDLDGARCGEPDRSALKELFMEYEFSSLLQEIKIAEEKVEGDYRFIANASALADFLHKLGEGGEIALDILMTEQDTMKAGIAGISLCLKEGEACYIPLGHDYEKAPPQLKTGEVLQALRPVLEDGAYKKHGHDLKNAHVVLARRGVALKGLGCDTMVASYLLNPSRRNFEFGELLQEHINRHVPEIRELTGTGVKAQSPTLVPVERAMDYACRRVDGLFSLARDLAGKIAKGGFEYLFYDVEMPLVSVLAAMEKKGVLLDLKLLGRLSEETAQLMRLSEEKIYLLAGEKFNINSPKQLQVILFEKLGIPRGKKTKGGYSTDMEVLAGLAKNYELPAEILSYRSLAKLKSTYIDALPMLVNPDTGRVHTSYNQAVTATGRLSSSNPNLQNIPIRTLEGKRIRQAFIAPEGWEIIDADYSQIELRVLAHLSGDRSLVDSFLAGEDIHSRTASDVFGVFPEMVNAEMRRQAKVINFGVLYGMSAFGLAKELQISQKLAQAYIDGYFRKYEGVRRYLDGLLAAGRRDGFVSTLLGRRRYLPDLQSGNGSVRQFAERMAINTPIQGTAADVIKLAMRNIARALAQKGLAAAMIMQVHDELVFEAPLEEKAAVMELVKREMEGVIELSIPLKIDMGSGKNWDEAHG